MNLKTEQLLEKGIAAQNKGNIKEAELIYKSILKTYPKNADANHNLGILMISYHEIERTRAALVMFKTAIEIDPNNEQYLMSYANTLYKTNQSKEAELLYRKVIKLNPDHVDAYNYLDNALFNHNKLDESLLNYKKAIELRPDLPDSFNNVAGIFKHQRKFDESESAFKQAINLKPEFAEAHFNLGNLYKDLGRFKEATSCFYKVLDINPNYPELYYYLMNTLENEAKYYHKQLFEDISISNKLKAIENNADEFVKKEIIIDNDIIKTLNKISGAINKLYGFLPGVENVLPSINQGPCGPFANEFYKQWNSRFLNQVKISFIMNKYPVGCRHVLIKLPNDKLFDGGVGVHDFKIYNQENLELVFMEKYDLETLDKHSWGITRTNYAKCPNYSLSEISSIIVKFLDDIYKK